MKRSREKGILHVSLFSEDSLGNFILVTFCDSDVFFSPETCRAQIVVCNSRTCKSEHFHSMEVKFRTPSLNVRHRRKKISWSWGSRVDFSWKVSERNECWRNKKVESPVALSLQHFRPMWAKYVGRKLQKPEKVSRRELYEVTSSSYWRRLTVRELSQLWLCFC